MTTFTEIQDEVKWAMARPDLAARVKLACIQAVHECHNLGYFVKDLRTKSLETLFTDGFAEFRDDTNLRVLVDITANPALWDISASGLGATKFRKLHKIEIFSDAAHCNLIFDQFKDRAVDPLYDDFKRKFANHYMQIGTNQLDITFYSTPEYTDLTYFWLPTDGATNQAEYASTMNDSFIVQDYPEVVVSHAIVKLCALTGQSDLRQEQLALWAALHDRIYQNEATV